MITDRLFVLDPVPQVFVHAPYGDQLDTLQSFGQAKVLQPEGKESWAEQIKPPCEAMLTTERVLVLDPVPHDFVQAPYADQPDT